MSRAYLAGIYFEERSLLRSLRHRSKAKGIFRHFQGKEGNVPWKLSVIRMEGVGRFETHTIPFLIPQPTLLHTLHGVKVPRLGQTYGIYKVTTEWAIDAGNP